MKTSKSSKKRRFSIIMLFVLAIFVGAFGRNCVRSDFENPTYDSNFFLYAIGLCRFAEDTYNNGCRFF